MYTYYYSQGLSRQSGRCLWLAAMALLAFSTASLAESLKPLVDDFSHENNNNLGLPRQYLNDSFAGGATTTKHRASEGVLYLSGDIVPPRGQPGWASSVLLLGPNGLPMDASHFDGIRLLIKINGGNASISANSTEITNFDYHAAPVMVAADGKFHEIKIPFDSMKRAWSEQIPLNTKTLTSLSLVAYAVQKGSFEFEVDEVTFYKKD